MKENVEFERATQLIRKREIRDKQGEMKFYFWKTCVHVIAEMQTDSK